MNAACSVASTILQRRMPDCTTKDTEIAEERLAQVRPSVPI